VTTLPFAQPAPVRPGGPRYALDIETTGLEWPTSRVTTVAVYSPAVSLVIEDADEPRLLGRLAEHLAGLPAGTICTWNGACFDVPYLVGRCRSLGLPSLFGCVADPSIVPRRSPQPGFLPVGHHLAAAAEGGATHDHLDVACLWQAWAAERGSRWGLKDVARAVGLAVIEVDRAHMDSLTVPERMAYNLSDVVATYELAGGPAVAA
jgi:DNA polymerase elongation subunit (family B)